MIVSTITSQVLLPGHIKLQVTNCPPIFLSKKGYVQESPQKERNPRPPQKKNHEKKNFKEKIK
jgi:hypothetical protein